MKYTLQCHCDSSIILIQWTNFEEIGNAKTQFSNFKHVRFTGVWLRNWWKWKLPISPLPKFARFRSIYNFNFKSSSSSLYINMRNMCVCEFVFFKYWVNTVVPQCVSVTYAHCSCVRNVSPQKWCSHPYCRKFRVCKCVSVCVFTGSVPSPRRHHHSSTMWAMLAQTVTEYQKKKLRLLLRNYNSSTNKNIYSITSIMLNGKPLNV